MHDIEIGFWQTPMKRLIFSVGTWQLLLASAALRQEERQSQGLSEDYLVLYGVGLSGDMKQAMTEGATATWDWKRIVWADDLLRSPLPAGQDPLLTMQLLRARVGLSRVDEVWVGKLFDTPEKVAVETYSQSPIVLYEDGLYTYIPHEYTCGLHGSFLLRPERLASALLTGAFHKRHLSVCIHESGACSQHINRLRHLHLFLVKCLPIPWDLRRVPVAEIDRETLLSVLRDTRGGLSLGPSGESVDERKGNRVLMLGQCFSRSNLMFWTEELTIYRNAVSRLQELGYTVLWKDHPRADRPFFPALAEVTPPESFWKLDTPPAWPIELFAEELDLKACVSATSTGLFNLRELFNLPAYTIANRMRWKHKGHRKVKNLVKRHIPSLADCPSA